LTVHLLDGNVLIALLDDKHPFAEAAGTWFERIRRDGWASCPMTENGAIRIMSSPKYLSASTSPANSARVLDRFCRLGGHQFWPDDISSRTILSSEVRIVSGHVADIYLLALAIQHGGRFATFDTNIPAHQIVGGIDALEEIPAPTQTVP
jgi:toxin-antitoxin system PIN domain toxin